MKLKKLLNENIWNNRKFGEPLPTLEDTSKAYKLKKEQEVKEGGPGSVASPLSKNLFHKAIHQSGGSSFTYPTSALDVKKLANSFANSFEDPSLKNLKNVSAEEILEVSEEVYAEHYFNYVDDGFSMIGNLYDTFKSRNVEKVDLLIGSNNDEWSLYFDGNVNISLWLDEETTPEKKIKLLHLLDDIKDPVRKMDLLITAKNFVCPSLFMAEELRKKGGKTWVYQFNRVRDNELAKKYGAFHGAELPYVFDTHDEWLPTNEADKELTREIQSYWLSFAQTGNPNNDDAVLWPEYDSSDDSTLVLDDEIFQRSHESSEICKVMELF